MRMGAAKARMMTVQLSRLTRLRSAWRARTTGSTDGVPSGTANAPLTATACPSQTRSSQRPVGDVRRVPSASYMATLVSSPLSTRQVQLLTAPDPADRAGVEVTSLASAVGLPDPSM